MALSDLIPALERDTFRMDARQERELCKMLVTLFADVSGDVRGHAVKWYASNRCCQACDTVMLDLVSGAERRRAHSPIHVVIVVIVVGSFFWH